MICINLLYVLYYVGGIVAFFVFITALSGSRSMGDAMVSMYGSMFLVYLAIVIFVIKFTGCLGV